MTSDPNLILSYYMFAHSKDSLLNSRCNVHGSILESCSFALVETRVVSWTQRFAGKVEALRFLKSCSFAFAWQKLEVFRRQAQLSNVHQSNFHNRTLIKPLRHSSFLCIRLRERLFAFIIAGLLFYHCCRWHHDIISLQFTSGTRATRSTVALFNILIPSLLWQD